MIDQEFACRERRKVEGRRRREQKRMRRQYKRKETKRVKGKGWQRAIYGGDFSLLCWLAEGSKVGQVEFRPDTNLQSLSPVAPQSPVDTTTI